MRDIVTLLDNNKQWAEDRTREDPEFFERLSQQQSPKFLWIGCSDSRVPANQITGLEPGEVFVHRNVGNVVHQTDLNCLSVLQFAVEVLNVEHIVVCGHYSCGGVSAAVDGIRHGMIDNWLRQIRQTADTNAEELDALTAAARIDRLCELNVVANVNNVARSTIIEDAWERGQELQIHSWIYRLNTGRITSLQESLSG
ncbi:MAG: carbonic anhydrase [Verrucomicrobiales bacterium]|jgi:carbonic anhydrase